MQEQINEKTVALSIKTAKLTAEVLQKAIRKMLNARKNKAPKQYKGKQTLKHLMKQNTGVSSMEITDANIKAFEPIAKKYGLDYSLKKVKGEEPPRYLVFFKGRDVDVMTEAFKEFAAKQLGREKKPSIRKALAAFKEKAKQMNQNREKVKNKDRGGNYETEHQKAAYPQCAVPALCVALYESGRSVPALSGG